MTPHPIDEILPFRIHVPDAVLADLRERLARTRFPAAIDGAGWSYGTERGYLEELCRYWQKDFDWRAEEAALNRFAQFRTSIEGLGLHFIHVRSREPNALPLVISHGWPGSIVEFVKIIGPLTDPVAHGGRAEDAFHVVCPSLPGYGFSDAPREPGWDVRRVAKSFAKLMGRLGYTRYGAQGGDWGSMVSIQLGDLDAAHLAGIHLNLVMATPPEHNPTEGLSPLELARLGEMDRFQKEELGYYQIQATKPESLGYGLNDSPAGLAAWIVEKFRTWSDSGGQVERRFSKDELLTNITIYWATQTINSSMRLYYESTRAGTLGALGKRLEVPVGCALFPRELFIPPRRWAEAAYNVQQWTEMPSGGHFAALEEPGLLVDDIRTFFRKLR
jgi:pimeloyl-ACP methyl ester carboxylesterase